MERTSSKKARSYRLNHPRKSDIYIYIYSVDSLKRFSDRGGEEDRGRIGKIMGERAGEGNLNRGNQFYGLLDRDYAAVSIFQ